MTFLPSDVWVQIAGILDWKSAAVLAQTCKTFRQLAKTNSKWWPYEFEFALHKYKTKSVHLQIFENLKTRKIPHSLWISSAEHLIQDDVINLCELPLTELHVSGFYNSHDDYDDSVVEAFEGIFSQQTIQTAILTKLKMNHLSWMIDLVDVPSVLLAVPTLVKVMVDTKNSRALDHLTNNETARLKLVHLDIGEQDTINNTFMNHEWPALTFLETSSRCVQCTGWLAKIPQQIPKLQTLNFQASLWDSRIELFSLNWGAAMQHTLTSLTLSRHTPVQFAWKWALPYGMASMYNSHKPWNILDDWQVEIGLLQLVNLKTLDLSGQINMRCNFLSKTVQCMKQLIFLNLSGTAVDSNNLCCALQASQATLETLFIESCPFINLSPQVMNGLHACTKLQHLWLAHNPILSTENLITLVSTSSHFRRLRDLTIPAAVLARNDTEILDLSVFPLPELKRVKICICGDLPARRDWMKKVAAHRFQETATKSICLSQHTVDESDESKPEACLSKGSSAWKAAYDSALSTLAFELQLLAVIRAH